VVSDGSANQQFALRMTQIETGRLMWVCPGWGISFGRSDDLAVLRARTAFVLTGSRYGDLQQPDAGSDPAADRRIQARQMRAVVQPKPKAGALAAIQAGCPGAR
jgi:hypothetical protein